MRFRLSVLGLLSAFLLLALVGFASAASLSWGNPVTGPNTIDSNAGSFTYTFNLTNSGLAADLTYSLRMDSGVATLGSATPLTIGNGSTTPVSAIVTAVINFPTGQAVQFLTGNLVVNPSGQGNDLNFPFGIQVNQATPTSALEIVKIRSDITKSQTGTFTLRNNGNTNLAQVTLSSSLSYITISPNSVSPLNAGTSSGTVSLSINDLTKVGFGIIPVTITALSGSVLDTETFNILGSFCKDGPASSNLTIKSIDISSDDDDDVWKLLEDVTVEVEVENPTNNDVDDVFVELGLFDSAGKNVADDLLFDNEDEEEFDLGDIRDDDKETATFEFKVPADVDAGNYRLAIKAYSDKVGESSVCVDNANSPDDIDVEEEDDEGKFIAFADAQLTPAEATCSDQVSLEVDVYNVGEEDQEQVKINLANRDLGISSFTEIKNDFDKGDKEKMTFTFDVPQDARDGAYNLLLTSEYDYDNDDGEYNQESDESFSVPLRVIGCTPAPSGGVTGRVAGITADLQSEAKAGQPLSIKTTIKNLGTTSGTFLVGASGYESWAELDRISERILTLDAGESEEVSVTFNVKPGVSGEQTFDVEVQSNGNLESQEVAVNIEQDNAFNFGNNTLVWILGAVIIILIILVIIVAVRVSKR